MHALHIFIILVSFLARAAGAGVSLLQSLHSGEFRRIAGVASETGSDVTKEEESEADGDYLEVAIRRHHRQPKRVKDAPIHRGSDHSLTVPFNTDHHPSEKSSAPELSRAVPSAADLDALLSGKTDRESAERKQNIAIGGDSVPHASYDAGSLALASTRFPAKGMVHGLELLIGIMLGVLLSLLALTAMGYWSGKSKRSPLPPQAPSPNLGLSGGKLELVQFNYHGAFFTQFTWALDGSSGSSDYDPVSILSDNREVGRVLGRLMATPNGEMYVMSAGSTWAILKRPLPNRRQPGQLWDFKVCRADGTPYVEVKQRSDTKCHVDDAVTQRRIMTVIGNFTYPVFLSGERKIHVWLTQGSSKPTMCAQCESRPEMETEGLPPSSQSRRFHVTTTSDIDASLVLAMLLGLQDVHGAGRNPNVAAHSSSSERGPRSVRNVRAGTASSTAGLAAGTVAASNVGPAGTGATSSSGNGGQGTGPSGQLASEEKAAEKPPPRATEPATAA
mmetsp:Transcript_53962/g.94656  ORF Transcript_53962/g.94656 Transcript_53962/m.94656 type:complete len:503 (-) Transcript_53962:17-1525(-)